MGNRETMFPNNNDEDWPHTAGRIQGLFEEVCKHSVFQLHVAELCFFKLNYFILHRYLTIVFYKAKYTYFIFKQFKVTVL